jgi:serine protease Do
MNKNLTKQIIISIGSGLIASFLTLSLVLALAWYYQNEILDYLSLTPQTDDKAVALTEENTSDDNIELPTTDDLSVVEVARQASPAVLSIVVFAETTTLQPFYFEDLFFGQSVVPKEMTEKMQVGSGSGFLVSSNGYIVTNRHVVGDYQKAEYQIITSDGHEYEASLIGRDPFLDIAVLKIAGNNFPYLKFGDSSELEIGQTVIAIGNALGEFRNTVSTGIISGLSRQVVAGDGYGRTEVLDEVIQTDAAINPGNSGGPLLDLSGRVVGVNVAMAQGSQNIGFALPVNSIMAVVNSATAYGRIARPYIGIRYITINAELKALNDLAVDYGALIAPGSHLDEPGILPNSPAAKAGLIEGDIILELNGIKITPDKSLASLLRNRRVGETVRLKVLRNSQELKINVVLEEFPVN